MDVDSFLVAVGVLILAGFLAHLGFKKWRLPDVLMLIALGVVLGPATGFVDVETFRTISPLIGTIAIMVILFDGGLEMRLSELKHGAAKGTALAFLVFTATAVLCAGVGHYVAGLTPMNSVLLGMALGGAGAVVVLPMIQQLGVRNESFTIVALEAAVSDVLVIVGIFALSEAITVRELAADSFAKELVVVFAVAICLGVAAGFLWARVLGNKAVTGHAYVLTLAVLLLLYIGTEYLKGSGPVAVLAFGLVVGNSRKARQFVGRTAHGVQHTPSPKDTEAVFGDRLTSFHQEVVFFIRNFFFFGLGVVLDISVFKDYRFLMGGLLLAVAVALGRYWGVMLLFGRKQAMPAWDRRAVTLMFPLGLAAAALSQVPSQKFHIAGTEQFASFAAVAIVLTNLLSGIGVYWMNRPAARLKLRGTLEPAQPAFKGKAVAPQTTVVAPRRPG